MSSLRAIAAIWAVLALGVTATPLVRADEPLPLPTDDGSAAPDLASAPSGPPQGLDAGFLNLAAYDVERVDGNEKVRVGDTVVLRIQGLGALPGVSEPLKELKLEVPPGTDSLNDQGWELDTESTTPGAPGEFRFKATPLKAGHLALPSLVIVKGDDPATRRLARTNPFALEVESAIKSDDPKPEQPADLRPPVSLHFPWWVIAFGALLLAGLLAGGIYGYRKWRAGKTKSAPVVPAQPPKPEDEVALAALAELERNGPLKRGEFKAHYFKVSEILKNYIGSRYRFDAAESTTREMINVLEEKRVLADQQVDRLETLFEKLDLVKFTDHVPLPDEGLRLVGGARDFVLTTRRPPEILTQTTPGATR